MQPKPFLKWAGGKSRSVEDIVAELPQVIDTYWEPCLGAAAVFFRLASEEPRRYRKAILSDANRELIECYQVVRDDVAAVIAELQAMRVTRKFYYRLRGERPKSKERRAARVIYLNRLAFNGLYRVDRAGRFNVPMGEFESDPHVCNVEVLTAASRALADVEIVCSDFAVAIGATAVGQTPDAVYFDPPYIPSSSTAKFVGYDAGGFTEADQVRLARLVAGLANEGVAVVASNADVPLARDLYHGHKIRRLAVSRAINSKGDKRGKVGELLITAIPKVDRNQAENPTIRGVESESA